MARKVFRTVDVDIDAGTHEEKVYAAALHPWRSHLRSLMLPLVRRETPVLAAMQKRIRSPVLDNYFLWTANLGTHTFFLVFLPILIWFGNAALGRDTVCLAAMGVFWSGFLKDFFCLPRPLSPPVHRLTMSKGAAFEYGFPSTHSTNSISVALYFIAIACEAFPADSAMRLPCILGAAFYASSVVFGRIYCGMHSITDVVGGTLLAYALYWVQWAARDWIQAMINSDAYWVFLTVPLFLILVGIHPDPIERCPCFEDSVCFLGVLIGVFPGSWVCTHTEMCVLGLRSNVEAAFGPYTLLIVLMKIALGVALLFVWRLVCKKVCYFILPPIYRAFNLPHRKFEIGARTYKSLRKQSIHPIPSVLDLQGLARTVSEADHVGLQSGIDLHERKVAECKFRGKYNNGGTNTFDEPAITLDPGLMLTIEDAPLRYDVDIVTKLIVYAGIGFIALCPAPIMFQIVFG